MAATIGTDLKIYNEQFFAGVFESLSQNITAFNGASANTIRLLSRNILGEYNKESFFQELSAFISRRDLTSLDALTDTAMTQEEVVGVKISRRYGPNSTALGAIKKIGMSAPEFSVMLGKMAGQHKAKDMLNTAILSVAAAIEATGADLLFDATGETITSATHNHLVSGMAKLLDQGGQLKCWVMHSKPFYDLFGKSISDKITNVADLAIVNGTVATLGLPVIVTNAPALVDTGVSGGSVGDDEYTILGLVENAVVATESEGEEVVGEVVTGLEQLVFRIQGEYAFNINAKGYAYDTTVGANPTDASLGSSDSWSQVATDIRQCAGFRILVKGA